MALLDAYQGHIVRVEMDQQAIDRVPYIGRVMAIDERFVRLQPYTLDYGGSRNPDREITNIIHGEMGLSFDGRVNNSSILLGQDPIVTVKTIFDQLVPTFLLSSKIRKEKGREFTSDVKEYLRRSALGELGKGWYAFRDGKLLSPPEPERSAGLILFRTIDKYPGEKTTFIYHQPEK